MDFVDATILRLADETGRTAVFDGDSLSQLVAASHDTAGLVLEPPFAIVFDEVSFLYDDEPATGITGSWMTMGGTERTEVALSAAGLGAARPRIDLLVAGAVVVGSGGGTSRVDDVDASVRPVADGIDLRVRYTDGRDEPSRRRHFPLAAAFVVRDATGFSLADLLDESRRLRPHLQRIGFGPRSDSGSRARRAPIVTWVLPATLFDDVAWPGATTGSAAERRVQRRRWTGAWLARERIGLVVPPT
jgi:hypothetical protein